LDDVPHWRMAWNLLRVILSNMDSPGILLKRIIERTANFYILREITRFYVKRDDIFGEDPCRGSGLAFIASSRYIYESASVSPNEDLTKEAALKAPWREMHEESKKVIEDQHARNEIRKIVIRECDLDKCEDSLIQVIEQEYGKHWNRCALEALKRMGLCSFKQRAYIEGAARGKYGMSLQEQAICMLNPNVFSSHWALIEQAAQNSPFPSVRKKAIERLPVLKRYLSVFVHSIEDTDSNVSLAAMDKVTRYKRSFYEWQPLSGS